MNFILQSHSWNRDCLLAVQIFPTSNFFHQNSKLPSNSPTSKSYPPLMSLTTLIPSNSCFSNPILLLKIGKSLHLTNFNNFFLCIAQNLRLLKW